MSYRVIGEWKGEEVVFYEEYGSYQGTFILVTEKDGVLRIYKDYFGSCSGCDTYQSRFDYSEIPTEEEKKEFVEMYSPFLERKISELTEKDIEDGVYINNKNDREFEKEDQKKLVDFLVKKYL